MGLMGLRSTCVELLPENDMQRSTTGRGYRVFGLAGLAGLVTLAVVYGLVSFLIARGVTTADRDPQEDHPANYALKFEDVEFPSRRGDVSLSGWYLPGDDAGPHLIFVHGNGSVRSGDGAVALAARMVERGYNVLMFDLRGHGSSGGDKVSGGYFEQWDVLGAFDYLVERDGGPGGLVRSGLWGSPWGRPPRYWRRLKSRASLPWPRIVLTPTHQT